MKFDKFLKLPLSVKFALIFLVCFSIIATAIVPLFMLGFFTIVGLVFSIVRVGVYITNGV